MLDLTKQKSLSHYNYAALKQGSVFFAWVFKAGQVYTGWHCHSDRRDYVNISCKALGMGLTLMEKYGEVDAYKYYPLKFHWKFLPMSLPKNLQGKTMLLLHAQHLFHVLWGYCCLLSMEEHNVKENKTKI